MPLRLLDIRKGKQQCLISMNCTFWQSIEAFARTITSLFFFYFLILAGQKPILSCICVFISLISGWCISLRKLLITLDNEEYLKLFQNFVLVADLLRLLRTRRFCARCLWGPRTRTLNNGFQIFAYCVFYIYIHTSIFPKC